MGGWSTQAARSAFGTSDKPANDFESRRATGGPWSIKGRGPRNVEIRVSRGGWAAVEYVGVRRLLPAT